MRRALAVPAGIGLTLLAFGVAFSTPSDSQIEEPFAITGEVGDDLVSHHHVVTVHDVSLARTVGLEGWTGTTSGIWLVVDATVASRVERDTVDANLYLGEVRYPATNRTSDTVDGGVADAGFPRTGAILIELPADVVEHPGARAAVLRLGPSLDVRLDSVIELRLDLTELEVHERVELERVQAGAR